MQARGTVAPGFFVGGGFQSQGRAGLAFSESVVGLLAGQISPVWGISAGKYLAFLWIFSAVAADLLLRAGHPIFKLNSHSI